jgi:hypothetical protein
MNCRNSAPVLYILPMLIIGIVQYMFPSSSEKQLKNRLLNILSHHFPCRLPRLPSKRASKIRGGKEAAAMP